MQTPYPYDAYARLREAIRGLPLGVTAELLGEKPSSELARLLRAADAYVLASRAEGMPNSQLEGMASGLACVATNIPAPATYSPTAEACWCRGKTSRPSPARSTGWPAARICASAWGDEALQVIRERYALDRVAARYASAYAALLGTAPAPRAVDCGEAP